MEWLERFALHGFSFPVFMIAFGSLMLLRASSARKPTDQDLAAVPAWVAWFASRNSAALQRWAGWTIISLAVVIAAVRLFNSP